MSEEILVSRDTGLWDGSEIVFTPWFLPLVKGHAG
jgi:hypothetical protein